MTALPKSQIAEIILWSALKTMMLMQFAAQESRPDLFAEDYRFLK
jgi:hypothetical protein